MLDLILPLLHVKDKIPKCQIQTNFTPMQQTDK